MTTSETHELRETQDRLLVLETQFKALLAEVSEKLNMLILGDTPKCVKMGENIKRVEVELDAHVAATQQTHTENKADLDKLLELRRKDFDKKISQLWAVVSTVSAVLVIAAIKHLLF